VSRSSGGQGSIKQLNKTLAFIQLLKHTQKKKRLRRTQRKSTVNRTVFICKLNSFSLSIKLFLPEKLKHVLLKNQTGFTGEALFITCLKPFSLPMNQTIVPANQTVLSVNQTIFTC
jgi:hypothetical protein